MKNSQKGFVHLLLVVFIVGIVIVGCVVYFFRLHNSVMKDVMINGEEVLSYNYNPNLYKLYEFSEGIVSVTIGRKDCFDDSQVVKIQITNESDAYAPKTIEEYARKNRNTFLKNPDVARLNNADYYKFSSTYNFYNYTGSGEPTQTSTIGPDYYVRLTQGKIIEISTSPGSCGTKHASPKEITEILNSITLTPKFAGTQGDQPQIKGNPPWTTADSKEACLKGGLEGDIDDYNNPSIQPLYTCLHDSKVKPFDFTIYVPSQLNKLGKPYIAEFYVVDEVRWTSQYKSPTAYPIILENKLNGANHKIYKDILTGVYKDGDPIPNPAEVQYPGKIDASSPTLSVVTKINVHGVETNRIDVRTKNNDTISYRGFVLGNTYLIITYGGLNDDQINEMIEDLVTSQPLIK